jgi:competence protein ComEC
VTSPLRLVAAALLAGALAGVAWAPGGGASASVVAGGVVAALALRRRPRAACTAAAAAAACAFALLRATSAAGAVADVEPQELAAVTATVTRAGDVDLSPGIDEDERALEATFAVETDAPACALAVRVRFREGEPLPPLLPGDRVRLVGAVAPVRPPTNPGERDRRTESLRRGVAGEMSVASAGGVTELPAAPPSLACRVRRAAEIVRRRLLVRLGDACGGRDTPAAALLGCLLLGDRSGLDDAVTVAFRDSGTAHLLSVSGLHVVLLAAAGRALAQRVVPRRVRRRLGLASLVVLLAVYSALCRFETPVVRAALFLTIAETARAAGRRPSPLDTLAAAAALVVAADPAQVLDTSFQLSFAAVAGLALLTRGFRAALFPSLVLLRKFPGAVSPRRLRLTEAFARATSTSLAASAGTAPIVAGVFGRLQPAAPLSNLAAVPLAAFLVPGAAALAAAGGVAVWLTAPLAAAAVAPLRVAVTLASRLPGATVDTGRPPPLLLVAAVALLLAAVAVIARRARAGVALIATSWVALAAAPFLRDAPPGPEIVALDVGHGLCVLARAAPGDDVLFDAGGHAPGVGARTIVPALRALGVRRLAAVFLSHQDADHCGALPDLLAALSVGEVVVPPGFGADPLPAALVAECRARGVPVTVAARGDVWARAGITVRIVSPCLGAVPPSDNETSLVAHVTLSSGGDELTALVPGDVEGATLHALSLDPTLPRARVLVLPHHGRGDPAVHETLARRAGAEIVIASTSATAPMCVPGAWVTGRDGAVRVRGRDAPVAFPWP